MHIGQTDPGALEILAAVQAFEDAEQLVGVAHVEADAVVAHKDDRLIFVTGLLGQTADLDGRLLTRLGELQGV
ncbi:hypothetical protein D9M68_828090 [compost metagenome]